MIFDKLKAILSNKSSDNQSVIQPEKQPENQPEKQLEKQPEKKDKRFEILQEHFGYPRREFDFPFQLYRGANQLTDDNVKKICKLILDHLGYTNNDYDVILHLLTDNNHGSGSFSPSSYKSEINIYVSPYMDFMQMLAVAIRECMHFYLYKNNVWVKDIFANEILTDTATIWMGFYDIMVDGYSLYAKNIRNRGDRVLRRATKVGYLFPEELIKIQNTCLTIRAENPKEVAFQDDSIVANVAIYNVQVEIDKFNLYKKQFDIFNSSYFKDKVRKYIIDSEAFFSIEIPAALEKIEAEIAEANAKREYKEEQITRYNALKRQAEKRNAWVSTYITLYYRHLDNEANSNATPVKQPEPEQMQTKIIYCTKCGNKQIPGANFCQFCGTKLAERN